MVRSDQLKTEGLRRLTRNGITFYACLDYRLGAPLRAVKKWRGYAGIEELPIIQAAIRRVAWFSVLNFFELVTVPPQSGVGESFAARLAIRIAEEAGLPYESLFKDHGMGKRYHLAEKTKPVPVVFTQQVTGSRILLFDDFSFTRWTMARSIEALRSAGNEVEGIVLC
jgi:hypothetical protein